MAFEAAKAHLAAFGAADRILQFEVSSATVDLAAKAIGCDGCQIAKSLSFALPTGPVLVVAAGDTKVDNRKFKDFFGVKPKMLAFDEVEALIGHAVGGVCPFGIKEGVKVYLDESLKRFETVYPAVGSSSSAIGLSLAELETFSGSTGWVDVTKLPEEVTVG